MKRELLLTVVCALAGMPAVAGQISAYVDAKGKVVYVNADDASKKAKPKRGSRHSVLVKQDPRTGQQITLPARPEPAEAVSPPGPSTEQAAASKPSAKQTAEPASLAKQNEPTNAAPERSFTIWNSLDQAIADTAERHEIDPELVRAIVKVESNFNPNAVSYKGAMGLMQLVPGTARRFGVGNVFDPGQNLDGGVRYLKHLLGLYDGNLRLSLAAYNAGEGAVERHGGIPPYAETQQYVRKISSLYRNGYIGNPFSLSAQARNRPDRWGIMKRVDERGRVHFSNTEGW